MTTKLVIMTTAFNPLSTYDAACLKKGIWNATRVNMLSKALMLESLTLLLNIFMFGVIEPIF